MSCNFGNNIKITVFGQSHSEAIGVVIDGLPAGFKIDTEKTAAFMARRAPVKTTFQHREKKPTRLKSFRALLILSPAVHRSVQ